MLHGDGGVLGVGVAFTPEPLDGPGQLRRVGETVVAGPDTVVAVPTRISGEWFSKPPL